MATYYFRNTGSNSWTTAANWSLTSGGGATGAVPTLSDDAILDVNSGNCTVDAPAGVNNLNCTGYVNTLTFTDSLNLKGNITLGAGMTVVHGGASGRLFCDGAAGNFTSNGVVFATHLHFNGLNKIYTFIDNWTIRSIGNNNPPVLNGSTVSVTTTFSMSSFPAGTTVFKFIGTGNIDGQLAYPLTIDTVGVVTIGGIVMLANAKLIYVAGTVTSTGNLGVDSTLAYLINCGGITWPSMSCLNGRLNIDSDISVAGDVNFNGFNSTADGGNRLFIGGSLTNNSSPISSSATTLVMNGTGVWSGFGRLINNFTINTTGTITVSGTVYYNTGTFTYTAGTVNTTGSTLVFDSAAIAGFNTSGMTWYNVQANALVLLLSDLNISNNLTDASGFNGPTYKVYIGGSFTSSFAVGGTCTYVMNGTGNLDMATFFNSNITLDTIGTITVKNTFEIGTPRTIKYVKGEIITKGSTLKISTGTINIDTEGMQWDNLTLNSNGANILFLSDCYVSGSFNCVSGAFQNINGKKLIVAGNVTNTLTTGLSGASELKLTGTGSISSVGYFSNPLTIDTAGEITFSGTINYAISAFTYIRGKINSENGLLQITDDCTLINMHKAFLRFVKVTSGKTLTMNKFFCGRAGTPVSVITSGAGRYFVTISPAQNVYAHFASVSDCELTQPGIVCITTRNADAGGNKNLLFGNQYFNGNPVGEATEIAYGFGSAGFQGFTEKLN
jgi:hypothetical protein